MTGALVRVPGSIWHESCRGAEVLYACAYVCVCVCVCVCVYNGSCSAEGYSTGARAQTLVLCATTGGLACTQERCTGSAGNVGAWALQRLWACAHLWGKGSVSVVDPDISHKAARGRMMLVTTPHPWAAAIHTSISFKGGANARRQAPEGAL
eukprot:1158812-Pelagomonas_calceolata.AAC.7